MEILGSHLIAFLFGGFFTLLVRALLGSNIRFFEILETFQDKLPPRSKIAKQSLREDIGVSVMDLSKQRTYVDQSDLDMLLKQLENFDYDHVYIRRGKLTRYSKNLQRLITTTGSEKFTIAVLQEALEGEASERLKPFLLSSRMYPVIKC
jgi:hypothetical protein